MEVCYCVVEKLELSSEYFGRYCKKLLLNQFWFYIFQAIQLQVSVHSWYGTGHCILSLWSFFGPYNAFPNGDMEIFSLGEFDLFDLSNMGCKVSIDRMERSGGVLLCCDETGA